MDVNRKIENCNEWKRAESLKAEAAISSHYNPNFFQVSSRTPARRDENSLHTCLPLTNV